MINSVQDLDFLRKCTKEELIVLVKRYYAVLKDWSIEMDSPKEIICDYRSEKYFAKYNREFDKYIYSSKKCNELLLPYVGKRFSDIPENVLLEYEKLRDEAKTAQKKADYARKKYDKLQMTE